VDDWGALVVDELGITRNLRVPGSKFDPAVDSGEWATYVSLRPKQQTGADPPGGRRERALQRIRSSASGERTATAATFGSTGSTEDHPVRGPLFGAGRSGSEGGAVDGGNESGKGSPGPSSTPRGLRPSTESRPIRWCKGPGKPGRRSPIGGLGTHRFAGGSQARTAVRKDESQVGCLGRLISGDPSGLRTTLQ
jgi:hypothetical protein